MEPSYSEMYQAVRNYSVLWRKVGLRGTVQCCTILKWPPLADRRKFRIIQTVHDIVHQHSCIDFNRYFTVLSTCTRSHCLSLFCRQASINAFRYSFFVNSIFLWNCVSYLILSIRDRVSFKSRLFSFLFSK